MNLNLSQNGKEKPCIKIVIMTHTSKYYVTITGAPGHRDSTNNAIAGPSRAECAVLTVAATAGFEAAAPGTGGPTSCPPVYTHRAKQLTVGVKMDATESHYSQKTHEDVIKEARSYSGNTGCIPDSSIGADFWLEW
ncbi:Putative elongation factor 1-alpha-like 3 [Pteropus alecto]|uniref:Putative elongation factor 1-alpha-like 3 n=1 Tax=Pteropus alecto TaxID=9402 RepID=L5K829_PTEAL|nr:Putative elongation factor 1-alpha-like 3 [Pteropus alecto]